MKPTWILFLPPSTSALMPLNFHFLCAEWPTLADHRPSHLELGLKSVAVEKSPCLPISQLIASLCHGILTSFWQLLFLTCWSTHYPLSSDLCLLLSQLITQFFKGRHLHYLILWPTQCSVCKLLSKYRRLPLDLCFTITEFSMMTFCECFLRNTFPLRRQNVNKYMGPDKRAQTCSWNCLILARLL